MNDKFDPLVDEAIESEKQQALRQFRLSAIALTRNQAGRASVRSSAFQPAPLWLWAAGTMALLLIFGVVILLQYRNQPSVAGVTKQAIEQALLHARETQAQLALPGVVSLDGSGSNADMTWSVQSVIYRLQRQQYSEAGLSDAVFRTLSARKGAFRTEASLDEKVATGLHLRIRKLSSNKAVARLLARYFQR